MDAGELVTVEALKAALVPLRAGLLDRIRAGMRPPQALDEMYTALYGERVTTEGRLTFRRLCARTARHIAMGCADRGRPYPPWKATGAEVQAWLYWLEGHDPAGALIMDLCYFAGFSVKRTAHIVGLDPPAILHVLRTHKGHLSFTLPPPDLTPRRSRGLLSRSTGQ